MRLLAVLFLSLVLAGLAVRFHATGQASSIYGPTHITAGGQGVFLSFSDEIHRFSEQGQSLGTVKSRLHRALGHLRRDWDD